MHCKLIMTNPRKQPSKAPVCVLKKPKHMHCKLIMTNPPKQQTEASVCLLRSRTLRTAVGVFRPIFESNTVSCPFHIPYTHIL